MAEQTLTVHTAFLPASARRSFHVSCKPGDVLVVQKEHEHGVTTHLNGVLCFLLDEEVYKYCHPKVLPQPAPDPTETQAETQAETKSHKV